jgi:hypothetical protein
MGLSGHTENSSIIFVGISIGPAGILIHFPLCICDKALKVEGEKDCTLMG